MKEILKENGFRMQSVCSCGGTYQETWYKMTPKGAVVINIKPNKSIWSMTIDNVFTCKGNLTNLQDKLNETIQAI